MIRKISFHLLQIDTFIIGGFFCIKILLHLMLPEYGYHRDEFYYIAIGDRFSFYNLDMLPLSPLYLKLFTYLFGYSIKVIHLASSLCGALSIIFTCLITRELGGKHYAVFLTGTFMLFSGFIIFGSTFSYDSLDFLFWVLIFYFLVRIFKTSNEKLWIFVGIFFGFGLLNKLTIVFFGFAIFVVLWLVPQRTFFRSRWIWIAGIIAVLFSFPFLIWQYQHDWYFLDFASNYAGRISYRASLPEFLWNQILPNNIISFPVWMTGLILLLFSSRWKIYRFFGLSYIFLFLLFYFMGMKFYFLVPFYALLLLVGSIKIEEYIECIDAKKFKRTLLKTSIPVIYVMLSMPLLPMLVPVLPVDYLIRYAAILGVDAGVKYENNQLNQLPQHFADRFGWEEMVREIANVFNSIPYEEKDDVGIITGNWGQASAVHFYRNTYKLPDVISADGWFYFETLRKRSFKNMYISIGIQKESLKKIFADIEQKGFYSNSFCMPHENNKPVYVVRKPKVNLNDYWNVIYQINPQFKELLQTQGVAKAIEYYRALQEKNPSILLFTERQINNLGYEYLGRNKLNEAMELFELNVEEYPESFNVYDSLGEAYMKNGVYELAVTYYKKSLEINPRNRNAEQKIKDLNNLLRAEYK